VKDLSDFIETPPVHSSIHSENHIDDNASNERLILIKSGCTFEEVRALALRNRSTHPEETVQWHKEQNNTYTLNRVVK